MYCAIQYFTPCGSGRRAARRCVARKSFLPRQMSFYKGSCCSSFIEAVAVVPSLGSNCFQGSRCFVMVSFLPRQSFLLMVVVPSYINRSFPVQSFHNRAVVLSQAFHGRPFLPEESVALYGLGSLLFLVLSSGRPSSPGPYLGSHCFVRQSFFSGTVVPSQDSLLCKAMVLPCSGRSFPGRSFPE